jgi:hypothetical protein
MHLSISSDCPFQTAQEENDAFLEWINQEKICEKLITYRSGREQAPGDDEGNRMNTIDRMDWKDQYFMTTVYLYSGDKSLVIKAPALSIIFVGMNEESIAALFGLSSAAVVSQYCLTWLLLLDTFFKQVLLDRYMFSYSYIYMYHRCNYYYSR